MKKLYNTIEQEEQELQKHLEDCKKGNHKFVGCDEWERTCIYCGKIEKNN